MKAYVLHEVNDFRYEDVTMPSYPSKDWAIVKVKAAGICSSDVARIFTNGTYYFPTIPGHEFAGIVHSVADIRNNGLIGKNVGIFPLIPCQKCPQCKQKHYEMCNNYDYIGSRRDGGFAEYVAVPIWNLIPLSDNIPFNHAAMLEPLAVGLHAVKMCGVKQGASLAVIGTGMIGISAAQWASLYGADASVIGRSEKKRNIIEECNLKYLVNNQKNDLSESNFVIEAVGTPESIDLAVNMTAAGGTLLLMGNPSADIILKKHTYWRILRKQLIVKGTWNSSYDGINPSDWTEVVSALSQNKLIVSPFISHQLHQEELRKGLTLMYEHKEPYCKVMTLWNE